ncbi:MAG: shikimate kinase [Planctomycetia bacterium]|nr:shikimate kinase [Planctomycetia bacterium]
MNATLPKNKIALIGYRAVGKTTISSALATILEIDEVDSDVLIERQTGKTIAAIFAELGEHVFRDLEENILAEILACDSNLIVSTGGGAPLRERTRERLRDNSIVVWLTATPETIARRMHGDAATRERRPALTANSSPFEEVRRVLTAREPIYAAASRLIVDTEGKRPDEIANEIAQMAIAAGFAKR